METLKKIFTIKTLAIVGGILTIIILLFIVKSQYDSAKRQEQIEKSIVAQKELQDNIIRSQAEYVTKKDIEKFAKDININLDVVREDMKKLNASIVGINNFIASSKGYTETDRGSDGTIPGTPTNPNVPDVCKDCDKFGYLRNTQVLNIEEKFSNLGIPFGTVNFSAWKEKPWGLTVLPRDYNVTTVIGTDEEGRHYTYNKFTIVTDGKLYPVDIKSSRFIEEFPESKFSWWNPKLAMAVSTGISTRAEWNVSPGIYFSPFSYGDSKLKPKFLFAQMGISWDLINKEVQLAVSPAMYNIGNNINIINNTYVGPTVSVNKTGTFSVLGTISLTF